MQANRFDRAAEAPILNTYVPIDFNNLYRIGTTQKEAVDQAAQQFGAQLQRFGEFRSPSTIDTENYYNLTLNRSDIQNAIQQMVSNPDYLKDAANRAGLQSLLNNIDYSSLSLLKESADNLRAGLQMRAKMQAEGTYNKNWDRSNIAGYDTLTSKKIFEDITPIKYMNANQLSNAYFDNLQPSTIGSVWKDGVKYQRTGITYDQLKGIATARFNDLISTPQGREYYREALESAGGDEDKAREAFTTMIANSQLDRIRNVDTVDPYWLAMAKHNSRGSQTEIVRPNPTRLDFLNDSITKSVGSSLDNRYGNYRNYIASLIDKYPNTKIAEDAKKGLKGIDDNIDKIKQLNEVALAYSARYRQTGSDQDYVNAVTARNMASNIQSQMMGRANKYILRQEFQNKAGFSPTAMSSKEYSSNKYLTGVKSALDLIKSNVALTKEDDLITGLGALYTTVKDENGTQKEAYQFSNSQDFLLPETVFQLASETKPRNIKRGAGIFRSEDFPLKELIESGQMSNVQFLPDNKMIKVDGNFMLSGKMRIPKEDIESALGTGIITGGTGVVAQLTPMGWFGRDTTRATIEKLFGGRKVKEVVGENGAEFYELDTYRALPQEDLSSEYWQRVLQRWQGGSSSGIGGASQAKDEYYTSAEQTLGY